MNVLLMVSWYGPQGETLQAGGFHYERVLNTYVISKFYRILYLSQSRLIFFVKF